MSKPRLVSFKLCPFVQRSIIVLNEKGVDFDIDYINIDEPPQWFTKVSPTGKVPILLVDNQPLFESAIICEYLDEVYGESIHPSDPFQKASNRAWVEFTANLYIGFFKLMMATDERAHHNAVSTIKDCLNELSKVKSVATFFNDDTLSMVDVAMAPAFVRFDFLCHHVGLDLLDELPILRTWSHDLLERESVKQSIVTDLYDILLSRMRGQKSYVLSLMD